MPGSLLLPSGAGFDPSAQFWVDRLVPGDLGTPSVIGPVLFGPVRKGLAFDGVAPGRDGSPRLRSVQCRLFSLETFPRSGYHACSAGAR